MENGQPFELAPGHTYTINISYSQSCNDAASDNWYANQVYVADGSVHIGTKRYDNDFVGADMSTLYTMLFRYGYIETRAKLAKNPAYGGIW